MNDKFVSIEAAENSFIIKNSEQNTSRSIAFLAMRDGKPYSKTPKSVSITKQGGRKIKIKVGNRDSLRLFFDNMAQFENACNEPDGSLEICFNRIGKIRIRLTKGALWHSAAWVPELAQTKDFKADLLPSAESGTVEAEIEVYYSNL